MKYRHLLRYNARICAGLGAWILVAPVASTMLVLFAMMAMTSMVFEHTAVLVLELLGPILLAFLGANLLRPEYQYNTLETVLTRPVSFRAVMTVRILLAALAVLGLEALLGLYLTRVMHKEFDLGLALLASAGSMVFLTALAIWVAAAWRSPTLGLVAAGAYWALDIAFRGQLNQLLTLRAYATEIRMLTPPLVPWWVGKLVLAGLAGVLIVAAGRAGARPAAQRSIRRLARTAAGILVAAALFIGTGALYKAYWGRALEAEMPNQMRMWYKHEFGCYGPVPAAYVVGPSFVRYIGYSPPWAKLQPDPEGRLTDERYFERQQLKLVALGTPNSAWADNALYTLGRSLMPPDPGLPVYPEDTDLCLDSFQSIAEDYPASPYAPLALQKLADSLHRLGRSEEAEAAIDRLLDLYAPTEAAYDSGGAFVAACRRRADSLRVAADSEPDPTARAQLVEQARGQMAKAADYGERVTQCGPAQERPFGWMVYGDVLADPLVGRTDEAEKAYEECIRLIDEIVRELMAIEEKDAEAINLQRDLGGARDAAQRKLAVLRGEAPLPSAPEAGPSMAPPPGPGGRGGGSPGGGGGGGRGQGGGRGGPGGPGGPGGGQGGRGSGPPTSPGGQ